MRLVLASASPRRAELLTAAGIAFDVAPADVDETFDLEESPDGYVRRIAQTKAEVISARMPGRAVLGADTVVLVDNTILGKPTDPADARRMLRLLSGRGHVVLTGVCLINPAAESGGSRRAQRERAWNSLLSETRRSIGTSRRASPWIRQGRTLSRGWDRGLSPPSKGRTLM